MDREDAEKLLDCCWGPRARRTEKANYLAGTRYSAYNRRLSYTVAILGVATGSGLFATLSKSAEGFHIVLAVASLVAAAIVAYQRSAQYATRSAQHLRAGADWGEIVNEIEELRLRIRSQDPDAGDFTRLRERMDSVTRRSPEILQRRYFKKLKIGETYLYEDGDRICSDLP